MAHSSASAARQSSKIGVTIAEMEDTHFLIALRSRRFHNSGLTYNQRNFISLLLTIIVFTTRFTSSLSYPYFIQTQKETNSWQSFTEAKEIQNIVANYTRNVSENKINIEDLKTNYLANLTYYNMFNLTCYGTDMKIFYNILKILACLSRFQLNYMNTKSNDSIENIFSGKKNLCQIYKLLNERENKRNSSLPYQKFRLKMCLAGTSIEKRINDSKDSGTESFYRRYHKYSNRYPKKNVVNKFYLTYQEMSQNRTNNTGIIADKNNLDVTMKLRKFPTVTTNISYEGKLMKAKFPYLIKSDIQSKINILSSHDPKFANKNTNLMLNVLPGNKNIEYSLIGRNNDEDEVVKYIQSSIESKKTNATDREAAKQPSDDIPTIEATYVSNL